MGQRGTVDEEVGGSFRLGVVAEGTGRVPASLVRASEVEVIQAGFGEQLAARERWESEVVLNAEGTVRHVGKSESVEGGNGGSPVGLDVVANGSFDSGMPSFGVDEVGGEVEEGHEVVQPVKDGREVGRLSGSELAEHGGMKCGRWALVESTKEAQEVLGVSCCVWVPTELTKDTTADAALADTEDVSRCLELKGGELFVEVSSWDRSQRGWDSSRIQNWPDQGLHNG
jgi:hypothetical protein